MLSTFFIESMSFAILCHFKHQSSQDHYFSVAMGQGFSGHWNENAVEWSQCRSCTRQPPRQSPRQSPSRCPPCCASPPRYIPQVLRGLAITPPLVMPYLDCSCHLPLWGRFSGAGTGLRYVGSMFLSDTAMLSSALKFANACNQQISARVQLVSSWLEDLGGIGRMTVPRKRHEVRDRLAPARGHGRFRSDAAV